ncbi:outer membrane chaperone Skp (OmpH) [Ferrimonas balearica DSM 9799]|uniref:Outer membrane chaperone Skp (OmpH) n=1 Tax=Ferrimonas balearica (strain DSM 9799 / CCM 4581 / KCTC 23876 / PAT) TaxID=550540 RepID=E1SU23_FERBD|nr:OmpH family outer membrane protein [Ferrimonas balearica]ADN75170.1 outer membrane chaperone Skp (OmpH) [Ferrimonas balearica DSM 9799]MBY6018166.1 OmpH family outer membrane protein [Halomonas denitrificans]MBY6094506.1 OmpH family outer membrane protein [Ferrimonas balearica]
MKKVIATAALMLATLAPAAMAEQKIAIVDMGAVVAQHPQREAIGQQMEKDFGERMAEVRKLQEELRGLAEKSQRDGALMSADQKTELERQAQALQSDLQLKGKALEEDMQKRQNQEQQKILMDVKRAIDSVAAAEGYDIVLEARAALFATDQVDISAKVVETISKGN